MLLLLSPPSQQDSLAARGCTSLVAFVAALECFKRAVAHIVQSRSVHEDADQDEGGVECIEKARQAASVVAKAIEQCVSVLCALWGTDTKQGAVEQVMATVSRYARKRKYTDCA